MAMNSQVKKQLVDRLVKHELQGWQAGYRAGEVCAMSCLRVAGFEAIHAHDAPNIKVLRAILRNRGESKRQEAAFWRDVLHKAGLADLQIVDHPDFAPAFVQRVREVWDEVREDVLAGLQVHPGLRSEDEPEQEAKAPARSTRRGPSNRRTSRHRGIRRRI